jgi:glycolate oxidase FAD binding subunit
MSSDVSITSVSVDGAAIERVVEPETIDDLLEVVAQIDKDDLHAVIVGGGTRLTFGNVGGPFDLAISTRRMNRVISYEPDNLTIAVEPGCTLAQIHELLAAQQQSMALDAAHSDRTTLGGAYATGMSGPRRIAGGSLKDWVIGVDVLGPDGTVAKAGGMVVKNVTGFDMMHVHYGALGAFGIVTRLNLKVFPTPGASRCLRFTFDNADDAHAAGVELMRSQLQPGSVLVSNAGGWTLTVRLDAPDNAIDRLVDRVTALIETVTVPRDISASDVGADASRPFTDIVDLCETRAVARLPITASRQADPLKVLGSGDSAVCGDLGSGLIYVAAKPDPALLSALSHLGVSPTLLSLPPDMKADIDVFGTTAPPVQDVARRLKAAFDPHGRFNRGRFVLGL